MPNQLIQKGKVDRWLDRNRWLKIAICVILGLGLVAEIYYYRTELKTLIQWPTIPIILMVGIVMFLLRFSTFQGIVGENKTKKRSGLRILFNFLLFIIFFIPVTIYYIGSLATKTLQPVEQISFIAIGLAFSGISFGAASISDITSRSKNELICAAKKFVLVTILFIIFIPLLNLLNQPLFKDINIYSIDLTDVEAWLRGITFYLTVFSFYGGELLFILGITDLIYAFINLSIFNNPDT
jgi:hypothetical protein